MDVSDDMLDALTDLRLCVEGGYEIDGDDARAALDRIAVLEAEVERLRERWPTREQIKATVVEGHEAWVKGINGRRSEADHITDAIEALLADREYDE